MPVTAEQVEKYQKFLEEQAERLGSFKYDHNILLWHYTTGQSLIKIVESARLYSTQVSCLNDSSEMRYGQTLFKRALTDALPKLRDGDVRVRDFIDRYLKAIDEVNANVIPPHAGSMFFVSCFTAKADDLSTWRAYGSGHNGYAIGMRAGHLIGDPLNALVKVNYDSTVHAQLAAAVVDATVRFYAEGLEGKNAEEIQAWEREFVEAWESKITYLQPLVKDPGFEAEGEYRILRAYAATDRDSVIILQKNAMMTRHVPLALPKSDAALLPIEKVMVGPCRHPGVTQVSVDLLLQKRGYPAGQVVLSTRPLQET
jgi:hypothetical protein